MELRQLRYFLAVGEEEHYGRAAARLRVAQPALSRQIQALEAELDVELFERLARGVRLTAAGRAFLDHCRTLVADLGEAVVHTRAADRGEVGILKLGFIEVAAWSGIVPDTIVRFRRSSPGVRLELNSMTTLDQLAAIRDGRIDAGFLYNPPRDDAAIKVLPLARHPVVLAVPIDSPFADRDSIDLAEVANEPFIGFHRKDSPTYFDQTAAALRDGGLELKFIHAAENEAVMLALVTTGLGLALVNSCQRWRRPRGIALIPVADFPVTLNLCFVHRPDEASPPLNRFRRLMSDLQESAETSSSSR